MSADVAGKGLGSLLQVLAGTGPQDGGQQLPQDVALRVQLGLGLDASLTRQPGGNVWRPLQKAEGVQLISWTCEESVNSQSLLQAGSLMAMCGARCRRQRECSEILGHASN